MAIILMLNLLAIFDTKQTHTRSYDLCTISKDEFCMINFEQRKKNIHFGWIQKPFLRVAYCIIKRLDYG